MRDHRHMSALRAVVKAAAVPCCRVIGGLVSHQCALAWLNAPNQVFVPVAVSRESCLIFLGHMETRSVCCAVSHVALV